jgi:hypothetical protein
VNPTTRDWTADEKAAVIAASEPLPTVDPVMLPSALHRAAIGCIVEEGLCKAPHLMHSRMLLIALEHPAEPGYDAAVLAILDRPALPSEGLREVSEALDRALQAALPASAVAEPIWQKHAGRWVPVEVFDDVVRGLPCPMRSSVTDAPCVLEWGHRADSPRFHRFAPTPAEPSAE